MRLLIVSNRLPLTVDGDKPETPFKRSIGGLVTGIGSYLEGIDRGETCFTDYLWIGWPGASIEKSEQERLSDQLLRSCRFVPVFLEEEMTRQYYYGFCNNIIWPLFHCFSDHADHDLNAWKYYQAANETFFATLKQYLREDDIVWIQDYHLMLLPQLIRNEFPEATVSFFLHIPFPAFDIFRHLSKGERMGMIEGLLGADLLGFHTYGYMRDFLECVSKVLKLDDLQQEISRNGRKIKVDVFPMGIDYKGIEKMAVSEACNNIRRSMIRDFRGLKVVLSIDRLDYTKGILNRLIAFDRLLKQFPEWREKVLLMLIVAPSRREIGAYRQIKRSIDEWVGNINGSYGTNTWVPVIYQYRQLDLVELCALYAASDVALVTPLKDGMNLIAKEYIASHPDKKGVLILSEMAGAIHELPDAIAVNPYCIDELVDAMLKGLTMEGEEQSLRNSRMHERLESYDVMEWAREIMAATLERVREIPSGMAVPVFK